MPFLCNGGWNDEDCGMYFHFAPEPKQMSQHAHIMRCELKTCSSSVLFSGSLFFVCKCDQKSKVVVTLSSLSDFLCNDCNDDCGTHFYLHLRQNKCFPLANEDKCLNLRLKGGHAISIRFLLNFSLVSGCC